MKWEFAPGDSGIRLARALRKGVLLAGLVGLITVPGASAVTYPVKGGNGFEKGPEGWSGSNASCSPGLLCSESNFRSATRGKPPGSLVSRLDVLANVVELFQGQATWRSPSFKATTLGGGALRYDRQLGTAALLTLGPEATIEPVLVDETAASSSSLGSETLTDPSAAFATRRIAVPKGTLSPGHRYRLELRSTTATTTLQAGLTGSVAVRYDNVALSLKNQGPGGSSGSDGVEFPAPPVSGSEAEKIGSQLNLSAPVGDKVGGGLLSRGKCTIIGTPRSDRITGSTGNDVICGLGGKDKIKGRGGKDVIDGGSGKDRLAGNGSRDTIVGLAGRDRLKGGPGRDRIGAGKVGDRIAGNGGRDRLVGSSGRDRLSGGSGRDQIFGGRGRDRVVGGKRDRLRSIERRG